MVKIRKLSKDSHTGTVRITVPPDVVDAIDVPPGAHIAIILNDDGHIEVRPVDEVPADEWG